MPPKTPPTQTRTIPTKNYNLTTTLTSGQTFHWQPHQNGWNGTIHNHWLHIQQPNPNTLTITTTHPNPNWQTITHYLQTNHNPQPILNQLPKNDPHLQQALRAHPGLRLLRQPPWQTLATFLLTSAKQIPHIQKITQTLTQHHGKPLPTPQGHPPAHTFPTPQTIANLTTQQLRKHALGYRAPYLRHAAQAITTHKLNLQTLHTQPYPQAKNTLQQQPGIGPKIADCILLFAYGKPQAFPIDTWTRRALIQHHHPNQNPTNQQLQHFAQNHYQPHPGYAQQYLYHHTRTQHKPQPKLDNHPTNH